MALTAEPQLAEKASASMAGRIYLKAGRDGPVRGGNPWIFSQAIARVDPASIQAGDDDRRANAFLRRGTAAGIDYPPSHHESAGVARANYRRQYRLLQADQ